MSYLFRDITVCLAYSLVATLTKPVGWILSLILFLILFLDPYFNWERRKRPFPKALVCVGNAAVCVVLCTGADIQESSCSSRSASINQLQHPPSVCISACLLTPTNLIMRRFFSARVKGLKSARVCIIIRYAVKYVTNKKCAFTLMLSSSFPNCHVYMDE
jgi:hypothetical protein